MNLEEQIARCRSEQIHLARKYRQDHPERKGIEIAISDWFREELLLEKQLRAE